MPAVDSGEVSVSGFWKEHKDVAQTGQRYRKQTHRQAHMSGSEKRSMTKMFEKLENSYSIQGKIHVDTHPLLHKF